MSGESSSERLSPLAFGAAADHEAASAVIVAFREHLVVLQAELVREEIVDRTAAEVARTVRELGGLVGFPFSVLLTPSAAIVAGRFLCAPRWVHEAAEELRVGLAKVGLAELILQGEPTTGDFEAFAKMSLSSGPEPARDQGKLHWRAVLPLALVRGIDLETLDPEQHFETAFGWLVEAQREFALELKSRTHGADLLASHLARTLIALTASELTPSLYGDPVRAKLFDPAEKAIARTLLALALLQRLTSNRSELMEVAVASLSLEATELAAMTDASPHRPHPSLAALALQAVSGTDEGSVLRTAVVYEALWLARQEALGPVYRGVRAPSPQACIVHLAQRCFANPELPLQKVVAELQDLASCERDRALLRLLCSVTGTRLPVFEAFSPTTGVDRTVLPPLPSAGVEASASAKATKVERDDLFTQQDLADIVADLGGEALPLETPALRRSSRPGSGRPSHPLLDTSNSEYVEERSSQPPVLTTSQTSSRSSIPPSILPGHLLGDSERRAKAEAAFDAAEAAYALGDMDEALAAADSAVTLLPLRPAYLALQAYLEGLQSSGDQAVLELLIDRVDRALAGAEPEARACYYRGMLLRLAGKSLASRQAFRKGLEIAPEDLDLLLALTEE